MPALIVAIALFALVPVLESRRLMRADMHRRAVARLR